jgi:hypothetical protein
MVEIGEGEVVRTGGEGRFLGDFFSLSRVAIDIFGNSTPIGC